MQAAAVLCVGCETAADPEVCVVFNAIPGLGARCSVTVCSKLVTADEGGGHSPSPLLPQLPFLSATFAIAALWTLPLLT